MTEAQFKQYGKIREIIQEERRLKKLSPMSQEFIAKIHAEVFNHKYVTPCRGCSQTWIKFMEDLERTYMKLKPVFGAPPVAPPKPKKKGKPMSEESKEKMRRTIAANKQKKLADTKVEEPSLSKK